MQYSIVAAIGMVLILEGILPFLAPQAWRQLISKLNAQNNRALRISGLICMIIGVIILLLAHLFLTN